MNNINKFNKTNDIIKLFRFISLFKNNNLVKD